MGTMFLQNLRLQDKDPLRIQSFPQLHAIKQGSDIEDKESDLSGTT